jgi:uncharacterized protein (UPF0332 family)
MTGDDFIAVAGKLAATFTDAASCRTAISRAYYGAFHMSKTFLADLGIKPPRNANVHVFVQHRLSNSGHEQAAMIGSLVADLHDERIHADYDLDWRRAETVLAARASVERASRIRSALISIDTLNDRAQIKTGIEEYERLISPRNP